MEIDEITRTLGTPLTGMPAVKKDGFGHAIDQQNSKLQALQMEQRRTAAFFGTESTQAQRVQSLVSVHQTLLARTQSASSAAQARVPQPDPQKYTLYGIVSTEDGSPVEGIDVSALDANNTVLQTSTTDACGAYTLAIDPSSGETQSSKDAQSHGSDNTQRVAAQKANRERAAATAPPALAIHLVATDKNQSFQFTSQITHEFAQGQLDREDITVPASRPEGQC